MIERGQKSGERLARAGRCDDQRVLGPTRSPASPVAAPALDRRTARGTTTTPPDETAQELRSLPLSCRARQRKAIDERHRCDRDQFSRTSPDLTSDFEQTFRLPCPSGCPLLTISGLAARSLRRAPATFHASEFPVRRCVSNSHAHDRGRGSRGFARRPALSSAAGRGILGHMRRFRVWNMGFHQRPPAFAGRRIRRRGNRGQCSFFRRFDRRLGVQPGPRRRRLSRCHASHLRPRCRLVHCLVRAISCSQNALALFAGS